MWVGILGYRAIGFARMLLMPFSSILNLMTVTRILESSKQENRQREAVCISVFRKVRETEDKIRFRIGPILG